MKRKPSASQKELSPETALTGALILDFPVSRTVKNKYLLFKPAVCGTLLGQPELMKTSDKEEMCCD